MKLDTLIKVVIADDDPDNAIFFRIILNQLDPSKELLIVKDGQELMDLLQNTIPDVLFLDLKMPYKTGYVCLEEIRQDPRLNQLPVVVYSSSTDINDIRKSFELEADLYMVKAFNCEHLKTALKSILKVDWWKRALKHQRYYFINNHFVPYTAA